MLDVLLWAAIGIEISVFVLAILFIRNWVRRKHWHHTKGR